MPFFDFRQNNSGGGFDLDHEQGITVHVIIEANSAEDANRRAEEIGLYFDGVYEDLDCECCGDRWSRAWNDKEGKAKPTVYGDDLTEVTWDDYAANFPLATKWQDPMCYVHYADGSFKGYW